MHARRVARDQQRLEIVRARDLASAYQHDLIAFDDGLVSAYWKPVADDNVGVGFYGLANVGERLAGRELEFALIDPDPDRRLLRFA